MEFGYTVGGFKKAWRTGSERIAPAELATQRTEYENFFRMFVESGARGAAPWWLPGGFRLGEQSDFGLLEPDGSERPACQVLREYLPRLPQAAEPTCVAPGPVGASAPGLIQLDFDAHYADAWDYYSQQYLAEVRAGRMPQLGTTGTGTTSATCPLLAVGNTPTTGRNPPKYLNAEFEALQIQESPQAAWREVRPGEVIRGADVRCRVTLGNTGEAAWLAPKAGSQPAADGRVWLRVSAAPSGPSIDVPIAENTPYLANATVGSFPLPQTGAGQQTFTLQLIARRKTADGRTCDMPFGGKATVACKR
jgi:hypothetical protein